MLLQEIIGEFHDPEVCRSTSGLAFLLSGLALVLLAAAAQVSPAGCRAQFPAALQDKPTNDYCLSCHAKQA